MDVLTGIITTSLYVRGDDGRVDLCLMDSEVVEHRSILLSLPVLFWDI